VIALSDPEYPKIAALITEAQRIIGEMNTGYHDPGEVRALFARLTGTAVDASFWLLPPFYTDFGKNIRSDATCSSITRASSWTAAGSPSRTMCSSAPR
jgi:hypothetical protein